MEETMNEAIIQTITEQTQTQPSNEPDYMPDDNPMATENPLQGPRQRRYKRNERGLESLERRHIESVRMRRLLDRLSKYFSIQFEKPGFRPVHVNKRLKAYTGTFRHSKIDIADMGKWQMKDTLWHEVLHGVVEDNYKKVGAGDWKAYKLVEKAVFQLQQRGQHGAFEYKLRCTCGYWIKSAQRKATGHCAYCDKTMVSHAEYRKLQRIAEIDSKIVKVDINRYKPWESNKKIGLKI